MSKTLPTLYLCRHGDTAWSPSRRFAGKSDIPLTQAGEQNARQLARRLNPLHFDRVIVSPLLRARRTAELAGYAAAAQTDPRLAEFNFGQYEGMLREDVLKTHPNWTYMRNGAPEGENADKIAARADSLLADLISASQSSPQSVLLFGHSVILRVLTARWLGLPPQHAANFLLSPASISILTYDPVDDAPAIQLWNDLSHLNAHS